MHKTDTGLSLSATDLSNSLACRQLTGLDMSVALEGRKRPFRNDPLADILRDRGLAHEKACVDYLRAVRAAPRRPGFQLSDRMARPLS